MKTSMVWFVVATLVAVVSPAHADGKWMDGKVVYKIGGVDKEFDKPDDACKAGVAELVKSGNKKTFVKVKDGTTSTALTCVLKETDGKTSDQTNIVTKVLKCPDTTSARSTNNSGEFKDVKCKCDDKAGCPDPNKKVEAKDAPKPTVAGNWMDGKVGYKIGGVDTVFTSPDDACKRSAEELTKKGNKKTFQGSKDGTSSTTMTCLLKESDGKPFEQLNQVTKLLQCPAGTTSRSTNNSGDFKDVRCKCDDKKGCPKS